MSFSTTRTAIVDRFSHSFPFQVIKSCSSSEEIFNLLKNIMEKEYKIIPSKERIGKGSVYLAKTIGKPCFNCLNSISIFKQNPWDFCNALIQKGDLETDRNLYNLGLALFSHLMSQTEDNINIGFRVLPKYASHPNWEIREMAGYAIRECMKRNPQETITALWPYVRSEDENNRRIVSESLRPLADISILRNPERNDMFLELLHSIKDDSSEYVRKSVGNNLKDLTKYMPEKILTLLQNWSKEYKINVTEDLASKTKKEIEDKEYNFIWMMKHALRWLRERNPEFHPQIEKLLGRNYVQYYDEKKNRLTKPPT